MVPRPTSDLDETIAIPIVSFKAFVDAGATDEQKSGTADELDGAFRKFGFVYLKDFGKVEDKIERAFELSKSFFSLPSAIKNLAPHPPGGSHHRGYSSPGIEKVSQGVFDADTLSQLRLSSPDVKESFELGNESDELQPNLWIPAEKWPDPEEGKLFHRGMQALFYDLAELVNKVLDALSLALSSNQADKSATQHHEIDLAKTHSQGLHQLRLLHYPPLPVSALSSGAASRISAHSDFGTVTLLFQDSTGGLELEHPPRSGRFIPVSPVPGTVIVNIGDLMERWSNGRWRSGVHRVVEPRFDGDPAGDGEVGSAAEEMLPSRYSIPFFATADPETVIEALPGCWDETSNPKKYEKTRAWEYVQMRMAALYD